LADLFIVGVAPIDYSPILLLKPFGFRIAPDTLSSGIHRATGSRSVLAVSGFRLRARLDFSIPSCSPGQRGITPAFGYSAPHPSAEGTSTPMIHALPSAHYEDCVIGGPGSFVVPIKGRENFKEAIRTKLIREVAGRTPEHRMVPIAEKQPRVSCTIGEKIWQDRWGR
jgi:hypothetical protein